MPRSHSKKRSRDEQTFSRWVATPDSEFERLGLQRDDLTDAQAELSGHIILPGDPTYDAERMLYNPKFSPAPCLIIVCATENDVSIALGLATGSPMPFTVRSGGHCTAGFSAAFGVLIDIKALDHISINVAAKRATVGAGCHFGAFNKALEAHGVHVPGGECSDVCIGGYVQGGGLGLTSTTFGMNCDNVVEMRVMLADGSIVVASETLNADLWWAMRGGTGGNFGVLLSVTYQVYELGDVFGYAIAWPLVTDSDLENVVDVLALLQQEHFGGTTYGPGLNLQIIVVKQTVIDPAKPPLPNPEWVFMVRGLWVGDPALGPASMGPLEAMPGAIVQKTLIGSYPTVLDMLLNYPQEQPMLPATMGDPNESKASRYVGRDLTPAEWSNILRTFVQKSPNDYSFMYLEVYGGAIAAYPMDNSAFIHRSAKFDTVLDVFWFTPKEREAVEVFLEQWIDLMETVWNGEVYQNYPSIDVPDYPNNYWGVALAGLVVVKRKYDPTRVFTFAQEVPDEPIVGPVGTTNYIPPFVLEAVQSPIDHTGGLSPRALV